MYKPTCTVYIVKQSLSLNLYSYLQMLSYFSYMEYKLSGILCSLKSPDVDDNFLINACSELIIT